MPSTRVPQRAAARVALPVPQATSSTRQPAFRSAASASCSLTSTTRLATTARSPLAQVFCWRALTADRSARSVAVVMTAPLSQGFPKAPAGAFRYRACRRGEVPGQWRFRTTGGTESVLPRDRPARHYGAYGALCGLLPDRLRGRVAGRPVDAAGHPRAHGGRRGLQRDPPGPPADEPDHA